MSFLFCLSIRISFVNSAPIRGRSNRRNSIPAAEPRNDLEQQEQRMNEAVVDDFARHYVRHEQNSIWQVFVRLLKPWQWCCQFLAPEHVLFRSFWDSGSMTNFVVALLIVVLFEYFLFSSVRLRADSRSQETLWRKNHKYQHCSWNVFIRLAQG